MKIATPGAERLPSPLRRRLVVRAAALEAIANQTPILCRYREMQPNVHAMTVALGPAASSVPGWMVSALVDLAAVASDEVVMALTDLPQFTVTFGLGDDLDGMRREIIEELFPEWQRSRKTVDLTEAVGLWVLVHICGISSYAVAKAERPDEDPDDYARTIRSRAKVADAWLSLPDYPLTIGPCPQHSAFESCGLTWPLTGGKLESASKLRRAGISPRPATTLQERA